MFGVLESLYYHDQRNDHYAVEQFLAGWTLIAHGTRCSHVVLSAAVTEEISLKLVIKSAKK